MKHEARGEDKLSVIETGVRRDIMRTEGELLRLQKELDARLLGLTPEAGAAPASSPDALAQAPVVENRAEPASADDVPENPGAAQVCSPAELEIARLLDEAGLDCAYRQPLRGSTRPGEYAPSFTIRLPDQLLLWEHLAHSESEEERARWQERQNWYAENGYDAGINLFVTRDEPDGSFKPERLRKVAEYIRSQCA